MTLPAKVFLTVCGPIDFRDVPHGRATLIMTLQTYLTVLDPLRGIFPWLGVVLSGCYMTICAVQIGMVGEREGALYIGVTGLAFP